MAKVNSYPGVRLLRDALAALEELDLEAQFEEAHQDHPSDGIVIIHRDGREIRYQAEIRRGVRRELIGPLTLALSSASGNRLLITEYVTPQVAEELRRRNIQFVDTAGNAFLKNRGLLIVVTGRRPPARLPMAIPLRVFRPSGIKTIFALLSHPELLDAPQREIARAAGVALGGVARIIAGLRELGFVAEVEGRRRLLRRERLLDQWTEAYARTLNLTLTLGRFAEPERNWWKHVDPAAFGGQWGGETAAAILQRHLVPEHTILYAPEIPSRLITQHRLKADPAGSVIVRRRFWSFEVERVRPDVVPPLLVYGDLVADGDSRTLEAAREIRDAYLD